MKKGCKKENYLVNHDYFKSWDHDMAYILGFIVADGNIQKNGNYVKVEVKPDDVSVLEFIRDKITPGYKLRQSRPSEVRWYPASAIIKSDLAKLGITPAKTGKEILPPNLPKKYFWDFVRGLFDGDGCVQDCLVCITSNSKKILDDLQHFTNFGYVMNDRMNWKWSIEDKMQLQKCYSKMYATGNFALERKKNRFAYLLSSQQHGKHRLFAKSEDDYIFANYTNQTRFEIAMALGRSGISIKNRLRKLGIRKGGVLSVVFLAILVSLHTLN